MVLLQESLRKSETMSAMGNLVGGVAHEIRNPLFAITALHDAYANELKDLHEFDAGIREQVVRLTTLTRELLDYGRPVDAAKSEGSIERVIDDAVRSRTVPEIAITTSIQDDLPAVRMDRDRMRQAFENLIDNALQHSSRGGAVRLFATSSDGYVECRIEDEGPGFRESEIQHAFEPFYSRRAGGTGLGLSIVERIIEQHDGSVSAANRPGGGAVVTVRLPESA
jgi:signal transduction histidine kinase